jgi:hypothetical protein
MTPNQMESLLKVAFRHCDIASCPLTEEQKQILLQLVEQSQQTSETEELDDNPLIELNSEELETFLEFVRNQEAQHISWKAQLLNDWLHGNDSGGVHFIRQRFGMQWLNRLQPYHFQQIATENVLQVRVGDRIEVCNVLWEWVQDKSADNREWYPCTVIQVNKIQDGEDLFTNCVIRFDNGAEYEVQGIYEWNQYNWRSPNYTG